jgi:hypothetical protein
MLPKSFEFQGCMVHVYDVFFMDILTVLVDVSRQFQEKTAMISQILVNIEVAVEQIRKLQTRLESFHLVVHFFGKIK